MASSSKVGSIVGWILSVLIAALMSFSAYLKLSATPEFLEQWTKMYPAATARPIGLAEIGCVILFLVPRTSVLGAVIMTGYLGGAVATHVQRSEPWFMAFGIGVVAWVALCLRDPAIWSFLPLRRASRAESANPPA